MKVFIRRDGKFENKYEKISKIDDFNLWERLNLKWEIYMQNFISRIK